MKDRPAYPPVYPRGLPYIIGNEAAERFSYYGMKAILVVFMTKYLTDASGAPAPLTDAQATSWYHLFSAANYFFPLIGAFAADIFLGKYRTIIWLSLVYCAGHAVLAAWSDRTGLIVGLTLIAIGAGGIKPCVSSHLGDQFNSANASLLTKAYAAFYLSINVGAFVSVLLTPLLLDRYGSHVAFAVPGILMFAATFIFWCGRKVFIAIPPVGWREYCTEFRNPDMLKFLGRLAGVYVFIAFFWALYDQTGSTWVLQAQRLDRSVSLGFGLTVEVLPSQLQSLNPMLIIGLTPVFSIWIYPLLTRRFKLTSLGKLRLGMALAALSFVVVGCAELKLARGENTSMAYQVWGYLLLTSAEILVSITSLEFAYTQAAPKLKSFVMSFYLLSVALGNLITAGIVILINNDYGGTPLTAAQQFFFFAGLAAFVAMLMALSFRGFEERKYLQA